MLCLTVLGWSLMVVNKYIGKELEREKEVKERGCVAGLPYHAGLSADGSE